MLRMLVLLLLPLVIVSCDDEKKCNVLLHDVNITWNKLDSKQRRSRHGLEDLHDANTINITDDHIPILCANTYVNFPELWYLKLERNKIVQIQPEAFSKVDKLEYLYLTGNHLKEIKEGVFNFLKIKYLYLKRNFIETIHPNAFDDMPQLHFLHLSDNRIRSIDSDWFKNTPDLKFLRLDYNKITSIQAYAFKNLKDRHILRFLPEAVFLSINLSHNEIKYIHPRAFDDLDKIGTLILSANQIKTLSENLFSTVTYMETLGLQINSIECFPDNLENLMKAKTLVVWGNPWNCSCADSVQKWADKNNQTISPRLIEAEICLITREVEGNDASSSKPSSPSLNTPKNFFIVYLSIVLVNYWGTFW